ncbi:ATPase [Spirochaetia bacterium]|nr:ATPase [Spirochaetia bacterium]GHV82099.1 ATPase [Spirochaetia bacterium]
MERNALQQLIAWKNRPNHKPLIIRGARQTGKTWLMNYFGRTCFENSVYISFDANTRTAGIFDPDLNPRRIIGELEVLYQTTIKPENTLLIFDEVQEFPLALKSLKYFNEEAPEYQIVCAGSLLGIALHPGASFPVGKVEFMNLYPLSFCEFLLALGQEKCVRLLEEGEPGRLVLFKHEYLDMLKKYFFVGGMPEAVSVFAETGDFEAARRVQRSIIDMYDHDFSKHAPGVQVPKIRMLWNHIPYQLAKENKKFVFGNVSKNARSRDFESAMLWILDTGIAHRVNRIHEVRHPLKVYEDSSAFKLYIGDIGLLSCMSGLEKDVLFEGDRLFVEFKGALAEQFVLQELIALQPFYWSNDNGRAEVDFLIQAGRNIVPIEVKPGINLRAKSLQVYIDKFNPAIAVRTSPADYHAGERIVDLPLYALSLLPGVVEKYKIENC